MNSTKRRNKPKLGAKVALSRLKRAAYNPRILQRPGDPAFEDLKASIASFGVVEPLVWNFRTENLVGGHQRLTILEDMGVRSVVVGDELKVVDLDERQERQLNLALNRIDGDWDEMKLAAMLSELMQDGTEHLDGTGFTVAEAERAMQFLNKHRQEDGSEDTEEGGQETSFPSRTPETVSVEHECPKCGYKF